MTDDLISRTAALELIKQGWGVTQSDLYKAIRALPAIAASQPADPAVKADSCQRIAAYLARRRKSKQTDYEDIHGYDAGCKTEVILLASDLEALIAPNPRNAGLYEGKIEVGMEFVWMDGTHAMEFVTVSRIVTPENDERRIWTKYRGGETWNDESRFREAVTLRQHPDPRDGLIARLMAAAENAVDVYRNGGDAMAIDRAMIALSAAAKGGAA